MKLKVNNLGLETTLEQFVKDWKLDLNKVKQNLENGVYYNNEVHIERGDDNCISADISTDNGESDEMIHLINEKYNNQYFLIEKEVWCSPQDDMLDEDENELDFTRFTIKNNDSDEMLNIIFSGGEYDEKFILTEKEEAQFEEYVDEGKIECDELAKYQEHWFVKKNELIVNGWELTIISFNLDDVDTYPYYNIELDPKDKDGYFARGALKSALNDHSGAVEDFSEVIDIDPANSLAHIERGKAKEKINYLGLGVGDYYGALEDYTLAIVLDTEYAESYRLRASMFIITKLDHYSALADYDKAIELAPQFAPTYFARGASKFELEDHSGALADFSKAIELDPELASAPYYKTFLNKSELSDDSNTVADINESTEELQEKVIATEDVNFETTTLVTKTHNINWVDVMSKDLTGSVKSSPLVAYDGAELLLKDFQLKNSVNVPAWFEDEDGDVYLLFKSNTEADAKTLINRIINENGGIEKFTEVSPGASWVYTFRADEFVIGYLAQHEVVRLNKIRPQPPEIIKEESEEDNTTELPDTINEIIQLIKSNPQAKIKIESSEWIDGSFQLSDDVESDSIEISDDEDGYDDFNVRKNIYSGSYYTWAQGVIENMSFLKCLNEFIKDEDIDPDEADIYDFYQYCQDYEIYTQDPESIKDNFEVKEYSEGTGRVFGLNEFSWYSVNYTRDADVEIKLLMLN